MKQLISRNRRIIRTDILRENMRKIRNAVSEKVKILAVVKADAYGHGAVETSRAVLNGGADMLAVASVAEGVQLRKNGILAPILVLGAVSSADAAAGTEYGLILKGAWAWTLSMIWLWLAAVLPEWLPLYPPVYWETM